MSTPASRSCPTPSGGSHHGSMWRCSRPRRRPRADRVARHQLRRVFRVPRSAADSRVRAVVANSPIVDLRWYVTSFVGFDPEEALTADDDFGLERHRRRSPTASIPPTAKEMVRMVIKRFGQGSFLRTFRYLREFTVDPASVTVSGARDGRRGRGPEPTGAVRALRGGGRRTRDVASLHRGGGRRRPLPTKQPATVEPGASTTGSTTLCQCEPSQITGRAAAGVHGSAPGPVLPAAALDDRSVVTFSFLNCGIRSGQYETVGPVLNAGFKLRNAAFEYSGPTPLRRWEGKGRHAQARVCTSPGSPTRTKGHGQQRPTVKWGCLLTYPHKPAAPSAERVGALLHVALTCRREPSS